MDTHPHVSSPQNAAAPWPGDPRRAARAMFGRVLSAWASDLLKLRRQGLDRPGYRRGTWSIAGHVSPGSAASPTAEAA